MRDDTPMGNQKGIFPNARPENQAHALPFLLPHKVACEWSCARVVAQSDVLPASNPVICEKGLSYLQINVLSLLHRAGARVTPYSRLSRQLADTFGMQQSVDSVRAVVHRLCKRGFLHHRQSREGVLQGVRFALVEDLLCPHIIHAQTSTRCTARPEANDSPSILEEIERKNLSISSVNGLEDKKRLEALTEEDIAFHWPKFAQQGFGTNQIRQIIQRRGQVNGGLQHILQGLTYAEWALEHKCLVAANGEEIRTPLNWLFNILAKQGYFARPTGYISPEERAEQDKALELAKQKEGQERHYAAACEVWLNALSPQERDAFAPAEANRMPGQQQHSLRTYFRTQVWQYRQNKG